MSEEVEYDLPDFMVTNELHMMEHLDDIHKSNNWAPHERVESPDDANLISSKMVGKNRHKVILDIDFPAALIPSTTEDHYHLYLDKELSPEDMEKLVTTLWQVGIIADGNYNQWMRNKAQFLRLPWIKKKAADINDPKDSTPSDVDNLRSFENLLLAGISKPRPSRERYDTAI